MTISLSQSKECAIIVLMTCFETLLNDFIRKLKMVQKYVSNVHSELYQENHNFCLFRIIKIHYCVKLLH